LTRKAKINAAAKRCAASLSLPLLALVALTCLAAPAQAARVHPLLLAETLPEERSPFNLAVNQSTHHFYLSTFDSNGGRRQVFNYEGNGQIDQVNPELKKPGVLPEAFEERAEFLWVGVDNSGGETDGYVYASGLLVQIDEDGRTGLQLPVVQQYEPSGEPTSVSITGSTIPADGTPQGGGLPPVVNKEGGFSQRAPVAVGSSGDVFVVDTSAQAIDVFSPTGAFIEQLAAGSISPSTEGIALDPGGDIYVAISFGETNSGSLGKGLYELDGATGACIPASCEPIDPAPIHDVAIDQAGGWIYTTGSVGPEEGEFSEYDLATHAVLGSTRGSQLHEPFGIGVQEATGEVILADLKPDGEGTIQIYGPVEVVPDVMSLAPSGVGSTTATLNGEIGAAGLTGATCVFQYVTQEEFKASGFEAAKTAPCVPAGPFSGEEMHAVHAEVEGLKGGTTYHQRILGSNAEITAP